jgi:hypothetical protein
MIPCLRSLDVVLFCCEVDGDHLTARWAQFNPQAAPGVFSGPHVVAEPKKPDGQRFSLQIDPTDLDPVTTDVRFTIVSVAGDR